MCGIAGVFYRDIGNAELSMNNMITTLQHRGPDGLGVYSNDHLALGHTRLSIIDLGGGGQPLYTHNKHLVLVANGEIYNHIELRDTLERKGHQFITHSDCETILHAYVEYGMSFLAHLNGMFAFALYDTNQNKLIIARDHLGMKPLFLYQDEQKIAFASEIKALLPIMNQAPQVNPVGLIQYLQNQNTGGSLTCFSGVESVLPGTYIVIENGKISSQKHYWSALDIKPQQLDLDEAFVAFDGLMETVITQHMRSDVPFGLFLSGGVDSTVLLGLLSKYKEEPIRTFSVGFPKSDVGDELETAQSLAQHFGSKHTVLRPSGTEMLQRLVYSTWAADDLMRDFANLPTSLLAEAASQELKVVFSGEGGDESFAGYARYNPSSFERHLKNILVSGSGGFRTSPNFPHSLSSSLFGAELQKLRSSWRDPIIAAWGETPDTWTNLQRRQYVDLSNALPSNLLVKADRMLMAYSLEGRLPFVDHRIVTFGLSLPDQLKIDKKQGKVFLKHWASRFLPSDHLWKKKRGFSVPVKQWLQGEYLNSIEEALLSSKGIQIWFNKNGISQLINRQHKKKDVSKNVMALLQFAIWHRLFIEGDGSRPETLIDPVAYLKNVK